MFAEEEFLYQRNEFFSVILCLEISALALSSI
jgi:hypothetical protein